MKINTFFDFCSGIGGGRLGLENCGLKSVGFSDTSRLSVKTYNYMHNTEAERNYGNLKKIDATKLPNFDLLIAGFPCQTFSVIGRKSGFNDDRGQIIFHLVRILNEARPKCFILENVRGLVSHDKGQTLKTIIKSIEGIGYSVEYKVLTSLNYGAPQMRQRVYFIGFDKSIGIDTENFIWPSEVETQPLSNFLIDFNNDITDENYERFSYYLNNLTNKGKYKPTDFLDEEYLIIDTRMSDLRLYRGKIPTLRSQRDGIFYIKNHKIKELTGYEALLLQGFPVDYADKVKDVVSNRHLLMQAGNAMTVNVIEVLGKSIIACFNKKFSIKRRIIYMDSWQQFEEDCYLYLKEKYTTYQNKFEKFGSSDSTIPDIKVHVVNNNSFFIEAKESNAQCGQFVLIPDETSKTFIYSERNKCTINDYSTRIISYMNENFNLFNQAGTKGQQVELPKQVFYNWITNYYYSKGVRYFITKGNNFIIFPIEKFEDYFDVTATYRMKKSGSADPSKTNQREVISLLKESGFDFSYSNEGKEFYISTSSDLDNEKMVGEKYTYMLKEVNENTYKVRQLSNTCNSNVIFSINLMKTQDISDLNNFESTIR